MGGYDAFLFPPFCRQRCGPADAVVRRAGGRKGVKKGPTDSGHMPLDARAVPRWCPLGEVGGWVLRVLWVMWVGRLYAVMQFYVKGAVGQALPRHYASPSPAPASLRCEDVGPVGFRSGGSNNGLALQRAQRPVLCPYLRSVVTPKAVKRRSNIPQEGSVGCCRRRVAMICLGLLPCIDEIVRCHGVGLHRCTATCNTGCAQRCAHSAHPTHAARHASAGTPHAPASPHPPSGCRSHPT